MCVCTRENFDFCKGLGLVQDNGQCLLTLKEKYSYRPQCLPQDTADAFLFLLTKGICKCLKK